MRLFAVLSLGMNLSVAVLAGDAVPLGAGERETRAKFELTLADINRIPAYFGFPQ